RSAADAGTAAPGDGATAIVLKRLADAERDGDSVYAVVRAVGTASGGRDAARDCASPRERARAEAVGGAAGISTGVEFGDVRCMIGHAGAALGLASVVRAAVALSDRVLPPGVEAF